MQGQSYQVKMVLEQYDTWEKTFLEFKDIPENPLGHLTRQTVGRILRRDGVHKNCNGDHVIYHLTDHISPRTEE